MLGLFFVHKFFLFTFILAILYILYEGFRLIRGINTGEYKPGKHTLLWVGLSIAHIITTLITGFIV